jgi:hypothetical protein
MNDVTPALQTWEVLKEFGFQPDTRVISDLLPGLSFDLSDFKLSASAVMNRRFAEVVMFTGVLITSRTMAEIIFELPRRMSSREQCAAWLVWNLNKHIDSPESVCKTGADWMTLGRANQHLLPWIADAAAYNARPCCSVDRESAKFVLKKLRAALLAVAEDADVCFSFDGEVMKIRCGPALIATAATGKAWTQEYQLKAGVLGHLPLRLMCPDVEFSAWEDRFTIFNHRYPLAT